MTAGAGQSAQKKLHIFLARAVDLSEKIQNRMQEHAMQEDIDELYAQRQKLFADADSDVAAWLKVARLTAADSWALYKAFLLALEDEHIARQYKAQDRALGIENIETMHANPFLLQEDGVDDKEVMDQMIEKRRLAPGDVLQMMANFTAAELLAMMKLARGVVEGSIWERKYDL
ncbi:hypothetical protein [Sulfurivermis fontis]|uniref:hypothetical protein n=1 Tax=Sulfurivermis fontis TaxID=1972068 RepID=UPI000FDA39AB|nr:hypothetical protein [Sulfurivermis fontis]